ncbi:amino acid ABC transporter substrate-binding protein [Pseudoalteromonas lipolytica]|uniref:amino acid ABC transporter substrate-binding protein n=1 Tax=Pseudoalteromonas lipolytica TaxID=570156 RepID=UPI003A9797EB
MKINLISGLSAVVVSLFSLQLLCAERASYVVGVENIEYLPYYEGSDNNNSRFTGYSAQLLKLFGRKYDYNIVFYPTPLNRLYKDFITQSYLDFKYPDNPQWQKSFKDIYTKTKQIVYSKPVVTTVTGIASLNPDTQLSDCTRFGKVRGFTSQRFKAYFVKEGIAVIETADTTELISLLLLNRINCIYISRDVLNYKLREKLNVTTDVYFHELLGVDVQDFHVSTINHPEIITQFNQFLATYSEEIQELKEKFSIGQ